MSVMTHVFRIRHSFVLLVSPLKGYVYPTSAYHIFTAQRWGEYSMTRHTGSFQESKKTSMRPYRTFLLW